jgi:hypothetical protein
MVLICASLVCWVKPGPTANADARSHYERIGLCVAFLNLEVGAGGCRLLSILALCDSILAAIFALPELLNNLEEF